MLAAIEPAIANTGDKITLEGTFDSTVTVRFPGGAPVLATVLGPHRATVTVPAAATAGDLTVTTCTATLGPVAFRRTSFALGLGNFESTYNQSSGARQTPRLTVARDGATAVVLGDRVYLVGGGVGGGGSGAALASVEQASINADGSLGAFATQPATLETARRGHTSVVIGGSLYVVGGAGSATLASVERAAIAGDGTLGSFATVPGVSLAAARHGHASVVVGNSLYILGGVDQAPLDSIERAQIRSDGTLSPFALVSGVHLATARHGHAIAVVGNFLYVFGGTGGSGTLDSIERAPIAADGSLGPFALEGGVKLAAARSGHSATALGSAVYLVGGGSGDAGALGSVEAAVFTADGLISAINPVQPSLVTARSGHATAIIGNHVYLFGGSSAAPLASLERATLDASGQLDLSAMVSFNLAATRVESAIAVIGNSVYLVGGGLTPSSTIERAVLGRDGVLGPFASVTGVALVTARQRHTTAVIGNYLYVIGGTGPAGRLQSVERATIQPDGSLGAFTVMANLAAVRTAHTSLVLGDYLYVIGGSDGTNQLASFERAAIQSDGTLGSFALVSGVGLTASSAGAGNQNLVIRNFAYVTGPSTLGIVRAPVASDGSLGAFADYNPGALRDTERGEATATVVGDRVYVLGGVTSGLGAMTDESLLVGANGGLLSGGTVVSLPRRSGHAAVVLGNNLYVLGGVDSNQAPIQPAAYLLPLK